MAAISFNGKDGGQVSSVSRKGSANERDRTGITDKEKVFAPGVGEREISVEGTGIFAPWVENEVGPLTVTHSNGESVAVGQTLCTAVDNTDDVDNGPAYTSTFKKAQEAGVAA